MDKVLGYFVFENVGDGCLVSKFANWNEHSPCTECARLKKGPVSLGFEGEYYSTWIEEGDAADAAEGPCHVTLIIQAKKNATGIFTLEWSEGATFYGEGMMYGKLLVGAYWDGGIHGPTSKLPKKR